MKYLFSIFFLFLYGCTDAPSLQSDKEIQAKSVIAKNISDAQKAKEEYLALQAKRTDETSL